MTAEVIRVRGAALRYVDALIWSPAHDIAVEIGGCPKRRDGVEINLLGADGPVQDA